MLQNYVPDKIKLTMKGLVAVIFLALLGHAFTVQPAAAEEAKL